MYGQIFAREGLGEVVRTLWKQERISPPRGLSNAEVWGWINRSDVAFSLVRTLVEDQRLILLAASALCSPLLELRGGTLLELQKATELVAYGIDVDPWIALCSRLGREQDADLEWKKRVAENVPPTWQDYAYAAGSGLASGVHAARARAPVCLVGNTFSDAVQNGWRGLRDKLKEVDRLPHDPAVFVANQAMLRRLRTVVNEGCFGAPCVAKRWEGA
jgi:hypothetical protein